MRRELERTRLLLIPPSPRATFTLNICRCPLPTGGPNDRSALLAAFHIRREFRVDISEFVYSFARGTLNIKCHPEGYKTKDQYYVL